MRRHRRPLRHAVGWFLSVPLLTMAAEIAWPMGEQDSYGPPEDHSEFISTVLLDDQRTCLFTFHRVVYRRAIGLAAFPDGGVPKYVEDVSLLATADVDTGEVRLVVRRPNTEWVDGGASVWIHSACGTNALVTESGQQRRDYLPAFSAMWVDLRDGRQRPAPFDEELARIHRGRGLWYLVDPNGTTLHITRPEDQPDAALWQNPAAELWLRRPDGTFERVGAGDYYGAKGRRIFFYDLTAHQLYAYDWTTQTTAPRPGHDPEYVAGLDPNGSCARSTQRGCRADGMTLWFEQKRNDKWDRTPIPVTLGTWSH